VLINKEIKMITYCKTCGHSVRKENNKWVHYDNHITHNVILAIIDKRYDNSVIQAKQDITWKGMKHCPICRSTNFWNTKEDAFCISCKYFMHVVWIPILLLVVSLIAANSWVEALSNAFFYIAFGLFLYGLFHSKY
jgi:hypothetical protein